jgi:hypothetical protein
MEITGSPLWQEQELMDPMVQRALTVQQVQPEIQEVRVLPVQREVQELQAPQVQQAPLVILV